MMRISTMAIPIIISTPKPKRSPWRNAQGSGFSPAAE
jgi:hypothetical protein